MYSRTMAAQLSGSSAINLLNRRVCSCMTRCLWPLYVHLTLITVPHYVCPLCPADTPSWLPVHSRQCHSGPRLTGWQCPLCAVVNASVCASVPLANWLSVPSLCTVDKEPGRHGAHTVGHWGTVIQRVQTTTQTGGTQWGTLG